MLFEGTQRVTNLSELKELNDKWRQLSGDELHKLVMSSIHLDTAENTYYYFCRLNGYANSALFSQFLIRKLLMNRKVKDETIGLDLTIDIVGLKLEFNRSISITVDIHRVVETYNKYNKIQLDEDGKPVEHNFAPLIVYNDRELNTKDIEQMRKKNKVLKPGYRLKKDTTDSVFGHHSLTNNVYNDASDTREVEMALDMLKKSRDKRKLEEKEAERTQGNE